MNKLKCPNCNGPMAEVSSIAPALVKCENCKTNFEASFVRGYWYNRPDLSVDDINLLVMAADYCAQSNGFEPFEQRGLKAISNKLASTVRPETFQYADERLKAVYGD